jgi:hypothetical protein
MNSLAPRTPSLLLRPHFRKEKRLCIRCWSSPTLPPLCDDDGASLEGIDSIVLLGGGLTSPTTVPPWVESRLRGAAAAHAAAAHAGRRVPLLVSGGWSPHRPPIADARGRVAFEAVVYADALIAAGVPSDLLLKETQSADTIGNAWYSYLEHARPARWAATLVVTNSFHMPRARHAFTWVWGLEAGAGTLRFLSTPDEGMPADVLTARAAKEEAALRAQLANAARVRDSKTFHGWLNTTHLCYAVNRQGEVPEVLAPAAAASY